MIIYKWFKWLNPVVNKYRKYWPVLSTIPLVRLEITLQSTIRATPYYKHTNKYILLRFNSRHLIKRCKEAL
jgi:hypothetical protein